MGSLAAIARLILKILDLFSLAIRKTAIYRRKTLVSKIKDKQLSEIERLRALKRLRK